MIFTVTMNPALDRSIVIKNFAAGKVNPVISKRDDAGGKGINVSKAVKELGGNTIALGVIGGSTGQFIKDSLDKMGIDSRFTVREAETRTNLKIQDPENHTTTDINESGAPLTKELADNVLCSLLSSAKAGDIAVISGKTDINAVDLAGWISVLKEKGVKVFLDTSCEALYAGVKAGPFAIKPNIDELSALAGCALTTEAAAEFASNIVKENGIEICLLSLGEDGAMCVTDKGILHASAPEVENVCTTGAGDTMLGAFAFALDTGKSVEYSLQLSVAAGSAAVACPGSQCPSKDSVYHLFEKVTVQNYEIP